LAAIGYSLRTRSTSKAILHHLEALASDTSRVSWHLHAFGHGRDGKMFYIPIHESKRLNQSPASHEINMAYHYVHSLRAMTAGARAVPTRVACC